MSTYDSMQSVYPYRRASWTFGQTPIEAAPLHSHTFATPAQRSSSTQRSEPLSPVRERSQELPSAVSGSHNGAGTHSTATEVKHISHFSSKHSHKMEAPMFFDVGAVGSVKARATQKKRKREEDEFARHQAEEEKKTAAVEAAVAATKKKMDDGPIRPPQHVVEAVRQRQLERAAARAFRDQQQGSHNISGINRENFNSADDRVWMPSGYSSSVWMEHRGVSAHTSIRPPPNSQSPMQSADAFGRRYSWHGSIPASGMSDSMSPYAYENFSPSLTEGNHYSRSSLVSDDSSI
jgi:hypothetical protein